MNNKSLKRHLLSWLFLPMLIICIVDAFLGYKTSEQISFSIQDKLLIGSARMIGQQVRVDEGVLQVTIPPAALELFSSEISDRVYYRVSNKNGDLIAGYYDLVLAEKLPKEDKFDYFNASINDHDIRVVIYTQQVFSNPELGPVYVEVAQTGLGRKEISFQFWTSSLKSQAEVIIALTILLWILMVKAISPIIKLRDEIDSSELGGIKFIKNTEIFSELLPIVNALNLYVQRLNMYVNAQNIFISNASHQLKTPLAILKTQVSYAIRNAESDSSLENLMAIRRTMNQSSRLVHQLLSHSIAESVSNNKQSLERFNVNEVFKSTLESFASLAAEKEIDFGSNYLVDADFQIFGSVQLTQELFSNLIDNAIRYTPINGVINVELYNTSDKIIFEVEDSGPGIPVEHREKVFERFTRLDNSMSDGCGLGLSIVLEIANIMNADIKLYDSRYHSGLCVRVIFPGQPPK